MAKIMHHQRNFYVDIYTYALFGISMNGFTYMIDIVLGETTLWIIHTQYPISQLKSFNHCPTDFNVRYQLI